MPFVHNGIQVTVRVIKYSHWNVDSVVPQKINKSAFASQFK